jgi:hypothetical protein
VQVAPLSVEGIIVGLILQCRVQCNAET